MNDRDRLLELLVKRSLEIRPVTLSSGRKSDYYIDCKRVTLSPGRGLPYCQTDVGDGKA